MIQIGPTARWFSFSSHVRVPGGPTCIMCLAGRMFKLFGKQTKSERVEQRTVNAIQAAIDKHLQDDDCSDEENSQSDRYGGGLTY